jgi:TonB family protein
MRGCIVSSLITIAFSCATAVSLSADEKKYYLPPGRAAMIYKPPIEYPYEARKRGITGRGVIALEIDKATGTVTKAYMLKSTGSRILDDAAMSAAFDSPASLAAAVARDNHRDSKAEVGRLSVVGVDYPSLEGRPPWRPII